MAEKIFESGNFTGNLPLQRFINITTKTGCTHFLPELLETVAILEANEGLGKVGFECEQCHKRGHVCRQRRNNGFRNVARVQGPSCNKSRS